MRMEITNYEEKPEAVNIDFEFGEILVNLTFSKSDLKHLHGIIGEVFEEWAKEADKKEP